MTQPPRTTGSRPGTAPAPVPPKAARASNAEARAVRIAAAKAERERKARTAKLRNLAIAIVVVVVVAVAAIVIATRHSSSSAAGAAVPAGLTAVTAPKGITGAVYGPAAAPVTITLFEDFQCPICEQLETSVGTELTSLADQGKIRIVWSMVSFLDTSSKNQYSSRAASAWYCAPQADRKALHTYLYAHQPKEGSAGPTDAALITGAKTVGISSTAYSQCVTADRYSSFATGTQTTAMATVATVATPTMFVNGALYQNSQTLTPATLDQIVAQESAKVAAGN